MQRRRTRNGNYIYTNISNRLQDDLEVAWKQNRHLNWKHYILKRNCVVVYRLTKAMMNSRKLVLFLLVCGFTVRRQSFPLYVFPSNVDYCCDRIWFFFFSVVTTLFPHCRHSPWWVLHYTNTVTVGSLCFEVYIKLPHNSF